MGKLLVLLVILCGAGGWNYHRNLQAENAEERPYRGLNQESLASLAEALEAEVEQLAVGYEAATGRSVTVGSDAMLGERVREFERVQSISHSTRAVGQRLSQSEGSLQRVRLERRRREQDADPVKKHLRRLLTIL